MAGTYNGLRVRNVRNYYVNGTADGRETPARFGPRAADGGIAVVITQRDRGDVIVAARVNGYVLRDPDGRTRLSLVITDGDGRTVLRSDTMRDGNGGES